MKEKRERRGKNNETVRVTRSVRGEDQYCH